MEHHTTPALPAVPPELAPLVAGLAGCSWVQAVALGGSRATGSGDAGSDFDVYVYADGSPDLADRRRLMAATCLRVELDNRYWETEDDAVLRPLPGARPVPVDVIYRSLPWLEQHLDGLLDRLETSVGYSTCLWHNLRTCRILFDRSGDLGRLQDRARQPWPAGLAGAIVAKNLPLLDRALPNYRDQILKAAARQDLVAVQHRTAAWLASYFDVVFAGLGLTHPGEKRLVQHLAGHGASTGASLPDQLEADVAALLAATCSEPGLLAACLDNLLGNLKVWLASRNLPAGPADQR